jgi:6-pyruvoyl-tetrahydropterin synthase
MFDPNGYAVNDDGDQLEFGEVKKHFRHYLDTEYDHRLLLNEKDPWARALYNSDSAGFATTEDGRSTLPGLRKVPGDPCTENITLWIAQWCAEEFRCTTFVEIEETNTNAVMRTAYPSPKANVERSMYMDDAWKVEGKANGTSSR